MKTLKEKIRMVEAIPTASITETNKLIQEYYGDNIDYINMEPIDKYLAVVSMLLTINKECLAIENYDYMKKIKDTYELLYNVHMFGLNLSKDDLEGIYYSNQFYNEQLNLILK